MLQVPWVMSPSVDLYFDALYANATRTFPWARNDPRNPSSHLRLLAFPVLARRLDCDLESIVPAYSVAQHIFNTTQ